MNNVTTCSILCFGFLLCILNCESKNITNNECINCTVYSGNCKMNTTGWAPFWMSKGDHRIVRKLRTYTDGDPHLALCVIDGYEITAEIETFICFWAPYMGCQAAASKNYINIHHMHHIACQVCARYCKCQKQRITAKASPSSSYFGMPGKWLMLWPFIYAFA
ncbi:uncharacterized protein Dvir_GJ25750, isoform C [Drosophila virilis]|uniref:Uncharacterized protein, isoform C n=1 Tax=Drosophila virilis TaxID=7244 RepID=A0A0Q9WDH0_DROVI|nr:uncharacterized protein LOC26530520 isoform X1 [Drosophila virilis]KRF79396.1 uncharacterized protein Dvir_GJ25750, isoform C [Drosophila virilis]